MTSCTTTAPTACRRCGRRLTSTRSAAAGIGPVCARREAATLAADTGHYTPEQIAKARRLIDGGKVTRTRSRYDRVVYRVRSGPYSVYITTLTDCTCRGAVEHGDCYHIAAARIVHAAGRPARPAPYAVAA